MDIIGDGLRNLREATPSDYYKSLQDPKKFKETILKLFSYD